MKNRQLSSTYTLDSENEDLKKMLEFVIKKLDTEITSKQNTIEHLEQEVQSMNSAIEEKNNLLKELNRKLSESDNTADGNRQLINKLLSDIDRLHLDIEWYKKTFEKRSLLGILKEKLKIKNK